ncbi:NAD-dependent epimerase/dehydratase family protein [Synechococcus sp. MW101C3]|uniref:NAD-dependent epimerase/dehydratase family protein n=1 Tax=Synechococcus sp. MW101C3 TaxID=210768 RepID=UPI000B98984B
MRIFVTGGTGFIGSHFLKVALEAGHEVLAVRRYETSHPAIPLPSEPTWIQRDLNDLQSTDLSGCDVVVHLASAGVSPKQASWRELVQVNVVGSTHLIATAQTAGVDRVIVAGTCHEYGASASRYEAIPPDAPLEPLSLYGASKAAAFHLLCAYARTHRVKFCYGRIFTAYGEGQYHGNFWPSLRAAALRGVDFPMTTGLQIRDFIPVEKVSSVLLARCDRTDIHVGQPRVENIGSGRPQTLLAFAEQEWRRLGANGSLLPGSITSRHDEMERIVSLVSQ